MATINDVDITVKRSALNMTDLGDITDDELSPITELQVLHIRREGEPTPEYQPLSPRIGECENLTTLELENCSSIPTEISNCAMLSDLSLSISSGNGDKNCQIELPEGIIVQKMTTFSINGGGIWNTGDIITWLAMCSSNLTALLLQDLTKDAVNQLIRELQNNEAFIEKFKHKLKQITFFNCNLNEDDALVIIVNITPLYPNLVYINLQNNNIEGLETIAAAVRETPPANHNLIGLIVADNPVSRNLNDPNSSDHVAMMCLLKYHTCLGVIESPLGNTTMPYSSHIDYQLIMNRSGLQYLVDDGHGGTRRSGILSLVIYDVYLEEQDRTTIFNFLCGGPIFRTNIE